VRFSCLCGAAADTFSAPQYVFSHLSAIPKASHDTDFARVRQWYLDGRAPHMRQTILLSAYDAPEMRSLWRGLVNVAGKRRAGVKEEGVMGEIREGIRQVREERHRTVMQPADTAARTSRASTVQISTPRPICASSTSRTR
jgi:hypothetical protein